VIEYPIIYIIPDGSEIRINAEKDEEGWQSIKSWYEALMRIKDAVTIPSMMICPETSTIWYDCSRSSFEVSIIK